MLTNLVELDADHPGFNDRAYRRRRDEIAQLALRHDAGEAPPRVDYTPTETATWGTVARELMALYPTHACRELNEILPEVGFFPETLPQLADVDATLRARTGFRVHPVAGLVSPRDFLGMLAERIFPATQYIRHHSVPHYTPEPDVVHELLGHVPMLADPDFAALTQRLGERSLEATDTQILQLTRLYWFTIEFGVVRQDGAIRAYGAGLLSSFGELKRAVAEEPVLHRLDVAAAAAADYPITTYQPLLWEVASIGEAFSLVDDFTAAW